jgi:hypothetical protein
MLCAEMKGLIWICHVVFKLTRVGARVISEMLDRYALQCLVLSWLVVSFVQVEAQVNTTTAALNSTETAKTSSEEGLSTTWIVVIVVVVVVVVGAAVGVGVWWWWRQQQGYAQVQQTGTGTAVQPGETPVIKVRLER